MWPRTVAKFVRRFLGFFGRSDRRWIPGDAERQEHEDLVRGRLSPGTPKTTPERDRSERPSDAEGQAIDKPHNS